MLEQEIEVRGEDDIGHLDLLVYRADGKRAIIDLKTGRVGAGWLQVGGYLYLSTSATRRLVKAGRAHRPRYSRGVDYGGILQVQRVKLSLDPMARLELRPVEDLIAAWINARRRVEDVLQGRNRDAVARLPLQPVPGGLRRSGKRGGGMTRYYTFNDDGSVAKVYDGVEEYVEGVEGRTGGHGSSRIGSDTIGPYRFRLFHCSLTTTLRPTGLPCYGKRSITDIRGRGDGRRIPGAVHIG